jgi:4-hydroxy-2-oxoheptanedioate aldolase
VNRRNEPTRWTGAIAGDMVSASKSGQEIMTARLKARLKAGEKLLGTWAMTESADTVEVMALAGVDFILIDHEHGQSILPDAIAQLRAMRVTDCPGIVRVPWNDFVYIKRLLDAGVPGIMVPQVNTVEEAKAAVAACRYPPAGNRGAAGGTRATAYGLDQGYYDRANTDTLVIVQVETPQAVENAAAIAAVDGVDVVFIGPRDLSASIGKLNKMDDPELRALIAKCEQAVFKSGKGLGTVAASGALAKKYFDQGYSMIISGSDVTHLRMSVQQMLKDAGR